MLKLIAFRIFTLALLLILWALGGSPSWQAQEDSFDNLLYPLFKSPEDKNSEVRKSENSPTYNEVKSPITILTVDSETIKALGWPLSNQTWTKVFKEIQSKEYDTILNLLLFSQKDKDVLSQSLKNLNVTGSSLKIERNLANLNGLEEDFVSENSLLYSDVPGTQEIPLLPLSLEEDLEVVKSYKKIGVLPYFSESQRNNSFQLYREFSIGATLYAIPFSSFWPLEDLTQSSFKTINGAKSDQQKPSLKISKNLFFADPYKSTDDYLKEQNIEKYSVVDVLNGSRELSKNRLLILSADGLDQFYPGPSKRLLPPHKQETRGDLVARSLSEFYENTAVASASGFMTTEQNLILIFIVIAYILGTLVGKEWIAFVLSWVIFVTLIALTKNNAQEIEIASVFILNFSCISLCYFICLLTTASLRSTLLQSIKLDLSSKLIASTRTYDSEVTSTKVFRRKMFYYPIDSNFCQMEKTAKSTSLAIRQFIFKFFKIFDASTHLRAHELVAELNKTSLDQIERRESETKSLIRFEQTKARGEILGKFLSDYLVSKFTSAKDLESALAELILPRRQFAAILQADVRGFSKLTSKMTAEEVVAVMQRYYVDIVNFSQTFAQVKLIGDAVFLFAIDDEKKNACSRVYEAAQILIESTKRQNSKVPESDRLQFGIAMNYGEVVAGNLSSNTCIDYTVIGLEVNKTARLEELTKDSFVSREIGMHSFLITRPVYNNLPPHLQSSVKWLPLAPNHVKVRSFPDIEEIGYVNLSGD
jgi:class 3 adenylate cyclase